MLRLAVCLAIALCCAGAFAAEPPRSKTVAGGRVKLLDAPAEGGVARATVVDDLPLAHTSQLLPLDSQGRLIGENPGAQTVQVLKNVSAALSAAGSSLERVVKLNLYIADDSHAEQVERVVAETFRGEVRPAVSLVVTRLPKDAALVAADAVGIVQKTPAEQKTPVTKVALKRSESLAGRDAHAAVLPAGARIYIAGQAEPGDLPTATRKTLESLRATLEFLGRGERDIVALKAFMTPMSDAPEVVRTIEEFFGERAMPPLSLVEWESTLPIEIELVAAGGEAAAAPGKTPPLEFLTPPGMTSSPVFSRVARINRGPTIYVGGLYGKPGTTGAEQVEAIFTELIEILEQTDSDLLHLGKATYYVVDDEASRALNELRPKYFDRQRPPAASKAQVRAVGRAGNTITLDMIAAPAK